MTFSIWRYSHLTLAVSSFLFIIIASVTGIILAFEPITNQLKPYAITDLSEVTISEMLSGLKEEYEEVIAVDINNDHFITASVITKDGDSQTFYIHPKTGKKIGDVEEKARVFKFATSLHRSLFLKSIGRFFVGLVSFLLFLITITGIALILKRQGGFKKFFHKITRENFYQYFHVVFGRAFLIPLIIITLTGVYLSLEKFNLLPKHKISHQINFDELKSKPQQNILDFSIFRQTKLSELKKIEFPFSPDVEDYFLLQLHNKEITVNQLTGEILSEVHYPFSKITAYYSLLLHTGQGSIFWAVILALACVVTLFFIYSGFVMTFERRKGKIKNLYQKDACEYIILVGSENGSTNRYAKMLLNAFTKQNKKSFIADLNSYTSFKNMKHLIVLTATYGDGDAPSNATNFLKVITDTSINQQSFSFSVVAFGSLSYPKYCEFGIKVYEALQQNENAYKLTALHKINNKSFEAFSKWLQEFNEKTGLNLIVDKSIVSKQETTFPLTLSNKTLNTASDDDTFLLHFNNCNKKFTSGDLLAVYPNENTYERLYSIANIENSLVLSVKKHQLGICSNYLFNLNEGEAINVFVKKNSSFHFPKKASKVIMIATGTGIAPFLGMIHHKKSTPIDLYFGLRNKQSLVLYKDVLKKENITNLYLAFSRETTKKVYVQNIISENSNSIINDLKNGAVIMICGSITMQNEVFDVLEKALKNSGKSLSYYKNKKQILVDCY